MNSGKGNVSVFAGANDKLISTYGSEACELGEFLAQSGVSVYFGGANTGLMGAFAAGYKDKRGIKLNALMPEVMREYPQAIFVESDAKIFTPGMLARLQSFNAYGGEYVVILPGGLGTLHELFYMMFDKTRGNNNCQIFVLNIDGFYNGLRVLLEEMASSNLLCGFSLESLTFSESVTQLKTDLSKTAFAPRECKIKIREALAKRDVSALNTTDLYGLFALLDAWVPAQWDRLKPKIGIIKTNGFWDGLLTQIDEMVLQGALTKEHKALLSIGESLEEVNRLRLHIEATKGLADRYWEASSTIPTITKTMSSIVVANNTVALPEQSYNAERAM